jgi:hypothetical protein
MDFTMFLLEFWGYYCILFFLILSFNPKKIKEIIDDLQDQKFTALVSFISITIGLINILIHNIWEANVSVIVTIIGWIALIQGILLFTNPEKTIKKITELNFKLIQVVYIFIFFIGIILLNAAYRIVPF